MQDDRAAPDEHLRAAHAGARRAADVPRHLAAARTRGRRDPRLRRRQPDAATSRTSTMPLRRSCSPRLGDETNGRVYNLGGDGHVSLLELAEIVIDDGGLRHRSRSFRFPTTGRASTSATSTPTCRRSSATSAGGPRSASRRASGGRFDFYREHGAHYWGGVSVPFLDLRARPTRLRRSSTSRDRPRARGGRFILGRRGRGVRGGFAAFCGARTRSASRRARTRSRSRLLAVGVGPGDEVITAPNTCIPTIVGIERAGATAGARRRRPGHATRSTPSRSRGASRRGRARSCRCTSTASRPTWRSGRARRRSTG